MRRPIIGIALLLFLSGILVAQDGTVGNITIEHKFLVKLDDHKIEEFLRGDSKQLEHKNEVFKRADEDGTYSGNIPRGNYLEYVFAQNRYRSKFYHSGFLELASLINEDSTHCSFTYRFEPVESDAVIDLETGDSIPFNQKLKAYIIPNHKRGRRYYKAVYGDEQLFFYISNYPNEIFHKRKMRKSFEPDIPDFSSYALLSQPKYRPGDTLKLSLFVLHKSEPYGGEVVVQLYQYQYRNGIPNSYSEEHSLSKVENGHYELKVPLSDSFIVGRTISVRYTIRRKKKILYSKGLSCLLEDYELPTMNVSIWHEQKNGKHFVKVKTSDATGYKSYGSKIYVKVDWNRSYFYPMEGNQYIPMDWTYTGVVNEAIETIELPGYLFTNLYGSVYLNVEILSTENELHEDLLYINIPESNIFVKCDSVLTIRYLKGGIEIDTIATLSDRYIGNYNARKSDLNPLDTTVSIKLPYTAPLSENFKFDYVSLGLSGAGKGTGFSCKRLIEQWQVVKDDSLYVHLRNPIRTKIQIEIYKADKLIYSSIITNAKELIVLPFDRDAAYYLRSRYNHQGELVDLQNSIVPFERTLKIHSNEADTIFPGSDAEIELRVTDYKGKPVEGAAVSASSVNQQFSRGPDYVRPEYSTTYTRPYSVFGFDYYPSLGLFKEPGFGQLTKTDLKDYGLQDSLSLKMYQPGDSLLKYFLKIKEESPGYSTRYGQLNFLLFDGPKHLKIAQVLVDSVLRYDTRLNDWRPLVLDSGYHTIQFRTSRYMITIAHVEIKPGHVTLLSFDPERCESGIELKKSSKRYSEEEILTICSSYSLLIGPPGFQIKIESEGREVNYIYNHSTLRRALIGPYQNGQILKITCAGKSYLTIFRSNKLYLINEEGLVVNKLETKYSRDTEVEPSIHHFNVNAVSSVSDMRPNRGFQKPDATNWDNEFDIRNVRFSFGSMVHVNFFLIDSSGNPPKYFQSPSNVQYLRSGTYRLLSVSNNSSYQWSQWFHINEQNLNLINLDWGRNMGNYDSIRSIVDACRYENVLEAKLKGKTGYLVKLNGVSGLLARSKFEISINGAEKDTLYTDIKGNFFVELKPGDSIFIGQRTPYCQWTEMLAFPDTFGIQNVQFEVPCTIDIKDHSWIPDILLLHSPLNYTTGYFNMEDPENGRIIRFDPFRRAYRYYDPRDGNSRIYSYYSSSFHYYGFQSAYDHYYGISGSQMHYSSGFAQSGTATYENVSLKSAYSWKASVSLGEPNSPPGALTDVQGVSITVYGNGKSVPNSSNYWINPALETLYYNMSSYDVGAYYLSTDSLYSMFPNHDAPRSQFSDLAYWQPIVFTDSLGIARFSVHYPDNLSSWYSTSLTMDREYRTGIAHHSSLAFLPLTAELSVPRFLVVGDSATLIGQVKNKTGDSSSALIYAFVDSDTILLRVDTLHSFKQYPIPVKADPDSMQVTFGLNAMIGSSDAEQRTIEIRKTGLFQHQGASRYVEKYFTDTILVDSLTETRLFLFNSKQDWLIHRLESLFANSENTSNEGLATRLLAGLLLKELNWESMSEIKRNRMIEKLIQNIISNQNSDGSWSWIESGPPDLWMSCYISGAVKQAYDKGYKNAASPLKQAVEFLIGQLSLRKDGDLYLILNSLLDLNSSLEMQSYLPLLDSMQKEFIQNRIQASKGNHTGITQLLSQVHRTSQGSIYLGNRREAFGTDYLYRTKILKELLIKTGEHQEEISKIDRFLTELMMRPQELSTYEQIWAMEAMLSHESSEGQSLNNSVTIILTDLNSGKPVPFEQGMSLKPSSYVYAISTQHPCFVSYYSRIHISQPKKLDSLYDIHTYFEDKNDRLNYLVAGEPVQLKVQLNVNSAAPYLKLIIPIPASCSYYTDLNSALYYQEKYSDHVEIYIPQLEAGNYEFWVYLIPKFSGTYTLNPTQIYQIYFPTFSGNNQCSKVIVQTSVE